MSTSNVERLCRTFTNDDRVVSRITIKREKRGSSIVGVDEPNSGNGGLNYEGVFVKVPFAVRTV